jgi:NAD(P)-dependent dehydrogenase (short-subunit alcohol dehydrogenase family)
VERFGGLDLLVCNAGILPPSEDLEALRPENWSRSLAVNLTGNLRLLQAAIPFLKLGLDASAILVASKNVPAPGPGAAAYSVAKAGLTQLGRVAALELAPHGVRVNMLHPDAVYDTRLWTPEVLAQRAARYGLTVDEYRTKNLLRTEITSRDVAALVCVLAGPAFSKTTGAQIPIDGGNDRVI